MGKGYKQKSYKPPEERFLVLVNAWGFASDRQAYFNNVGAWFEIMLRRCYPKEKIRVLSIYYQGTHKTLIIELPDQVKDVQPFLGSHPYSSFLNNDTAVGNTNVAEVYEYDFQKFNHPDRTNWKCDYPSYKDIHPRFPVREPYPLPGDALGLLPIPTPPLHTPYALRIPIPNFLNPIPPLPVASCSGFVKAGPSQREPALPSLPAEVSVSRHQPTQSNTATGGAQTQLRHQTPIHVRPREPSPPIPGPPTATPTSRSSPSAFTPYTPPSHHPKHSTLTTARPQAQNQPRPETPTRGRQMKRKKIDVDPYEEEENAARVLFQTTAQKTEPASEADEFLQSMSQYHASSSSSRPTTPTVKPEPMDEPMPSHQALTRMATPPLPVRIKPEPRDNISIPPLPSRRSTQRRSESESRGTIRIKPEPMDHGFSNSATPGYDRSMSEIQVKRELLDPEVLSREDDRQHLPGRGIPLEEYLQGDEGYEPSAELVALLQGDMVTPSNSQPEPSPSTPPRDSASPRNAPQIRVKMEQQDMWDLGNGGLSSGTRRSDSRDRYDHHRSSQHQNQQHRPHSSGSVALSRGFKRRDDGYPHSTRGLGPKTYKRVKREPTD